MKYLISHIVVIVLCCLTSVANAQTIKASIDREKILIGEQILLTLQIENVKGTSGGFNLPDSFNHIEVVERRKIDTLTIGKVISYRQVISLTSFDSGTWQIPGLAVQGITQNTKPLTIEVLPVDVSGLIDYHDIKEIIEVEEKTDWLFILMIALSVLVLAGILYWFFTRKKKKVLKPVPATIKQSALEKALADLDKLEAENLYEKNKVKEHYSRVVDISREFFGTSTGHTSLQKTTDEWMLQLQYLQVNAETKTTFFQLLRLADAVKFAKYLPPEMENENSVKQAKNMLQEVADWYKDIRSLNKPDR